MRLRTLLVVAVLIALPLAGCANGGSGQGKKESTTTDQSPALESVAPPGIYDLPDGTTQAIGVLTHRDLEGGFWAVVKTTLPEEAATAEIVAVIVPPQGLDLQPMEGQFVSVIGKRNEGPSIYMAGPVLNAETVKIVANRQ